MAITYVSPTWFYGIDTLFEAISLLVAFLVGYFSYKAYKFSSEKKHLYFAYSFFVIAISFFIKILTNVVIEYQSVKQAVYGLLVVTTYTIHRLDYFYNFGVLTQKFLMLTALMAILYLNFRLKDSKLFFLLAYFILVTTLFSHYSYYVYHLTAALILGLIAFYYSKNCRIQKTKTANLVKIAFIWLFFSQLSFIFLELSSNFYVLGEILQLTGYLFLLYAFILVLKK